MLKRDKNSRKIISGPSNHLECKWCPPRLLCPMLDGRAQVQLKTGATNKLRTQRLNALSRLTALRNIVFLFEKKTPSDISWTSLEETPSSARQAHFSSKQQPYYCEEDREHEEHVGRAHHRVVGQLVRLAAHFVNVEADGEDKRCHAEQDHCGEEEKKTS